MDLEETTMKWVGIVEQKLGDETVYLDRYVMDDEKLSLNCTPFAAFRFS